MARDWTGLLKATLFTVVLFAIGLAVRELGFDDPSIGIFTLLTVAFLIIFAVTSGRLASLNGPGGMKASFHDFLEKDSSRFPSSKIGEPVSSESLWMMRKGSPEELSEEMRSLAPGKHAALVLQEGHNYEPDIIHDYEIRRAAFS